MAESIDIPTPERVWEESHYGILLRANVYFKLFPYIIAHHDKKKFKSAKYYAAYEAYKFYLNYLQPKIEEFDENDLTKDYSDEDVVVIKEMEDLENADNEDAQITAQDGARQAVSKPEISQKVIDRNLGSAMCSEKKIVLSEEEVLRRRLLSESKKLVEEFRESDQVEKYEVANPAFRKLALMELKPEVPAFEPIIAKKNRKKNNTDGTSYSTVGRRESAIEQRELVAKFCVLVRDLSYIQKEKAARSALPKADIEQKLSHMAANRTDLGKSKNNRFSKINFPKKFTKNFFQETLFVVNEALRNENDAAEILRKYASVAPLIYALSSCVAWKEDMMDDFLGNLRMIILRYNEMYDLLVNQLFQHGREENYTEANVLTLTLPPPPGATLPKPIIEERLIAHLRSGDST